VDVLRSDYLTQGPVTPEFEKQINNYTGSKYSVAVINATSALHLACLALEVGSKDIVWTSPISFVASANCALYCGAKIDFVDIDEKTYNISIEALKNKLEIAKKNNVLPKVLIPVHLAGQSCEMEDIFTLSKKYGFKIIEDASHAIGGEYKSSKIGSCEYSDITVFSFHPVKIITTCEGGLCTTNDKDLFAKIYRLRSHGIVRNIEEFVNKSHGQWYYEQIDLGYNYRLNDLQSALGINQLKRIDSLIEERQKIAKKYNNLFKEINYIKTPYQNPDSYSSYHLYIIRIDSNSDSSRKRVFEKLRNSGFFVNIHYIPIYLQPYFKKYFLEKDFPNSNSYYSEAVSIPIYPGLKDSEIKSIFDSITKPLSFQNIF
jgi:UDP-4-amino-4,6-dideoxy-N-acetyl-beta-L-altrosamine transaminase